MQLFISVLSRKVVIAVLFPEVPAYRNKKYMLRSVTYYRLWRILYTGVCKECYKLQSMKNIITLQPVQECYDTAVCERMLWSCSLCKNVMILRSVKEYYDTAICERMLWYCSLWKNVNVLWSVKECYDTAVCERILWYCSLWKNVMILQLVKEFYDTAVCERSDILQPVTSVMQYGQ